MLKFLLLLDTCMNNWTLMKMKLFLLMIKFLTCQEIDHQNSKDWNFKNDGRKQTSLIMIHHLEDINAKKDHCQMIRNQTYINCSSILESSSTFPLSIILTISKPLYTLLFTSELARLPFSFTRKTPEERWLLRCLVYYWVLQKLCKIFSDEKRFYCLL